MTIDREKESTYLSSLELFVCYENDVCSPRRKMFKILRFEYSQLTVNYPYPFKHQE